MAAMMKKKPFTAKETMIKWEITISPLLILILQIRRIRGWIRSISFSSAAVLRYDLDRLL